MSQGYIGDFNISEDKNTQVFAPGHSGKGNRTELIYFNGIGQHNII